MVLDLPTGYRSLDEGTVTGFLASLDDVRRRLGGRPEQWTVREVGDGNLNLVFLVQGPEAGVCVKQALPYVRAAGESWPMPVERAYFEHAYYAAVAPHVGGLLPAIHHYSPALFCTVMEWLKPHIILRRELIAGRRYPRAAVDIGEFVARACFFTSDLADAFEGKMDLTATFARNQPPMRISVDLIFRDPYRANARNRWTSPQLDAIRAEFHADTALKLAVARLGHKFLSETQALIHGDLHSGSVMVAADDTRVIDPEFAMMGPIGFDLGAYLGNLLLNWYAQPGHAADGDDRAAMQDWILDQLAVFWDTFRARFLALWREQAAGDAYPADTFASPEDRAGLDAARQAFIERLFDDMIGFAACKMIRRILGFAHVIDFEQIADPDRRAAAETGALLLARTMLTHPGQFRSIGALVDATPRFARASARKAPASIGP